MLNKEIDDAVEVDDEEAQQIIAATRHKQIQRSFAKLTEAVIASNGDDKLLAAAEKQTLAIAGFSEAIKQIEINPTEYVSSLSQIRDDIVASNKELVETIKTRLLPDTFTLNKSYGGVTETVKVHYTPANQIT